MRGCGDVWGTKPKRGGAAGATAKAVWMGAGPDKIFYVACGRDTHEIT